MPAGVEVLVSRVASLARESPSPNGAYGDASDVLRGSRTNYRPYCGRHSLLADDDPRPFSPAAGLGFLPGSPPRAKFSLVVENFQPAAGRFPSAANYPALCRKCHWIRSSSFVIRWLPKQCNFRRRFVRHEKVVITPCSSMSSCGPEKVHFRSPQSGAGT